MAKHNRTQNHSVKHRNRRHKKTKKAKKLRHKMRNKKISNTKIKLKNKSNIITNKNHRFIKNLSSHNLTNTEMNVLGKGLKFIPTPKCPNRINLLQDANKFIRRMRLRYIRRHKKIQKHKFKRKSEWTPPTKENTRLENYLEAT